MARVKTARKENTILEAASRVFGGRPFHEVLIDEIAADGGIGKGTIYRYFDTKQDLYVATILHAIESLAATLENRLSAEPSPSKRLELIATEVLRFFWNRRYLLPVFQRDESQLAQAELMNRRHTILRFVQETILAGIECREFRGIDARIGAEIFLGMVRSVNLFHREDDTIDELVAQVMGVFSNGVAREPA